MNTTTYFRIASPLIALTFFSLAGCAPAPENVATPEPVVVESKPDMAAVKAEIQAIENAWSAADNAGDIPALLAFYSDDAVSMGSGSPMAVGKAAIQKEMEANMASRPAGVTVSYEVIDVFGDENTVTEVGKMTRKDASGKEISTGKYMAVWEKRNGKYICVRDISNNDSDED